MTETKYGFVGLGAMGAAMAQNLTKAGNDLIVFDIAGTKERAPEPSQIGTSLQNIAQEAKLIYLSLPDGSVSETAARDICATDGRRATTIVDFSTVGVTKSQSIHALCAAHEIDYIDAPVSGGQAGAKAGTLTIIWGGPQEILDQHRSALSSMAKNIFHVGNSAGQGQAMKLLINFLSATALAATSEAISFGLGHGLDMATMLEVLNVSTGQNQATSDKFPKRVLTGTFDAGFRTALMAKDLALYFESVVETDAPRRISQPIHDLWQSADKALPESDFTQIYEFVTARP
jgi:3-hydroxyisobutyrate dehydrogenase-like beta-hydroxyacid dehydrogenase